MSGDPSPDDADHGPINVRMSDFDFHLPQELIAQIPLAKRDASRMLVLGRTTSSIHHGSVAELPNALRAGDLLVANNSRVLPARLHARRLPTGGSAELLLLRKLEDGEWMALARPAKRMHPGIGLALVGHDGHVTGSVVEVTANEGEGQIRVRIEPATEMKLAAYGQMPLPPYIHTELADQERYQTTYASVPGSAAAPTAGLHVTPSLRQQLLDRGVGWAEVTLHIGLDTFRPVQVEQVAEHTIHREWCSVSDATARQIAQTRAAGGRVIALGTTAARVLETLGQQWDARQPTGIGTDTSIFIVPGYQWRIVDGLLTNFHLPRSTLLLMVSALAGRHAILNAYTSAITHRYRFFSFGDAMLII